MKRKLFDGMDRVTKPEKAPELDRLVKLIECLRGNERVEWVEKMAFDAPSAKPIQMQRRYAGREDLLTWALPHLKHMAELQEKLIKANRELLELRCKCHANGVFPV